MKVYFEITEADPTREYLQVRYTNDDGQEYWRNSLPMDWSPEGIQREVESYAPYIVAYWNRIRGREAMNMAVYQMSGEFEAEEQRIWVGEDPADPVIAEEPEYDPFTQRIEQEDHEYGDPEIKWKIVQLDPDEVMIFEQGACDSIRNQRNYYLQQTDFIHMPDAKVENAEEWMEYRQALRDIPQQDNFPRDVVWPQEPTR